MTRKPATAAMVPIVPRILAPTQTAIPTMFGPGMNWQRLTMSANSRSLIQRRVSTAMRRAQTIPPPPPTPQSETIRKAVNKALRGTAGSSSGYCATNAEPSAGSAPTVKAMVALEVVHFELGLQENKGLIDQA